MVRFENVWEAIHKGMSNSHEGVRIMIREEEVCHLTPQKMMEEACLYATGLVKRGIRRGDRVAIVAQTTPPVLLSILGCWRIGAVPVPLPLPMRAVSLEAFLEQTAKMVRVAEAGLLIVPGDIAPLVRKVPVECPLEVAEDLREKAGRIPETDAKKGDPALLQFTSGSTTEPRGVVLSHGALLANALSIIEKIGVTPEDRVVSWLPWYHDMGLIGFILTALVGGTSVMYMPPQLFVSRPALWLEMLTRFRATLTGGPNFAYALITRIMERGDVEEIDLRSLRLALNGAEPVDLEVMERLTEVASRYGMAPEAPYPVYGLAEASLAVTFPPPGRKFKVDWVSRYHLECTGEALPVSPRCQGSRPLISLGSPLSGLEVRIRKSNGTWAEERELGEVCIRGASLMEGYWKNPERTGEVMRDGWLRTGDQGYISEGELYLTGRIKDMIIIGGRNIFPEDVEFCGEKIPGVRKGNAVAFGVTNHRGRERLVFVAETHLKPGDEADRVIREVLRVTADEIGIPLYDAVLVRAGSLPKTTSGKKQRSLCREIYLAGNLQIVSSAGKGRERLRV
jgi:fatty-acyl-CoA synthase